MPKRPEHIPVYRGAVPLASPAAAPRGDTVRVPLVAVLTRHELGLPDDHVFTPPVLGKRKGPGRRSAKGKTDEAATSLEFESVGLKLAGRKRDKKAPKETFYEHDLWPSKVYKFGCGVPPHGTTFNDHLIVGHAYEKDLVKFKRERAREREALLRGLDPAYAQAVQAAVDLVAEKREIETLIKKRNSSISYRETKLREGRHDNKTVLRYHSEVDALKAEREALSDKRKAAAAKLKKAWKTQAAAKKGVTEAPANADVLTSFNEDTKTLLKDVARQYKMGEGVQEPLSWQDQGRINKNKSTAIHNKRFDGSGAVGGQVQDETPKIGTPIWQAVSGGSRQVFLGFPPESVYESRSERRRNIRFRPFWFRLGFNKKATPSTSYIAGTFTAHRRIHPRAIIKDIKVQRVRHGRNFRWFLLVTVKEPPPMAQPLPRRTVGIDPGWRQGWHEHVKTGVRAATLVYSDGEVKELTLPRAIVEKYERIDAVTAQKDRATNGFVARFRTWLGTAATVSQPEAINPNDIDSIRKNEDLDAIEDIENFGDDEGGFGLVEDDRVRTCAVPNWLAVWVEESGKWRNHQWKDGGAAARELEGLTKIWAQARFVGDEGIFDDLNKWHANDSQLYRIVSNMRRKVQQQRDALLRQWADMIAHSANVVGFEDTDFAALARKVKSQKKGKKRTRKAEAASNRLRGLAAGAIFRDFVRDSCRKTAALFILTKAPYSTVTCNRCSHVNRFPAGVKHMEILTCDNCHTTWNRDVNGAANHRDRADARAPFVQACRVLAALCASAQMALVDWVALEPPKTLKTEENDDVRGAVQDEGLNGEDHLSQVTAQVSMIAAG